MCRALARLAGGRGGTVWDEADGVPGDGTAAQVVAERADGTVVRVAGRVAKAHAAGTDPRALAVRLGAAAAPQYAGVLLPPAYGGGPVPLPGGRLGTVWPYGTPVDPHDPAAAPWEEAGTLLALLHTAPVPAPGDLPGPLPPMRGPAKAARALVRMRRAMATSAPMAGPGAPGTTDIPRSRHDAPPGPQVRTPPNCPPGTRQRARPDAPPRSQHDDGPPGPQVRTPPGVPYQSPPGGAPPGTQGWARESTSRPAVRVRLAAAARTVERAWAGLPDWCRDEAPSPNTVTLCHGDFHLGQLVRHPASGGPWHLIDVDDLGLGDPAWDLARPACWYAVGLLPQEIWDRFLGAYARTCRARGAAGATGTAAAAGTAGGLAGPDPWPLLDAPARAVTVQTAALGVAKARAEGRDLDEAEEACVAACARMAAPPGRDDRGDRAELPARPGP
ncbi:phosphotransferase [Streptomyces albus subsp. chlorinus]|nr:phosphotransferase [Streptomyces albus subsp. chlorinus]